ncbi:hypothetical protein GCM10028809_56410 [Spirosoma gilvum]
MIVKTDNVRIQCRIIAVDESVIRYRRLSGTTILRINKTLVNRIVYANGKVVSIKPPIEEHKPIDNEHESIANVEPTNKPEPKPKRESELDEIIQDIEKDKSIKDRKVRLHTILFDTGSKKVDPQSFAYLDSIALFLVKIPTVTVEISGYTDNTGSVSTNSQLSQSRANAVRAYLVGTKKIAGNRIQAMGYGQTAPLATNNTELGRALNRRVELRLLGLSSEVYTIQLKNGRRIPVTFVVSSVDNKTVSYRENANAPLVRVSVDSVEFIEYPDGSRRLVGSTELLGRREDVPPPPVSAKKFTIQLNGFPTYMLGTEVWTSLSEGYGHTIGGGGSLQFDYWLSRKISVGAELGYLAWSTQVDLVEKRGDPPYYTYYTKANQAFLMGHVRVKLGNHAYLMPQGGISQLNVTIDAPENGFGFSGTQTNYGGTLGYLIPIGRTINLDAGLFYQAAIASTTLKKSYVVDPMQFVGVRLGLGFSH